MTELIVQLKQAGNFWRFMEVIMAEMVLQLKQSGNLLAAMVLRYCCLLDCQVSHPFGLFDHLQHWCLVQG